MYYTNENELKRLRMIEKIFKDNLLSATGRTKHNEVSLSNKAKESISTSLTSINLKIIRRLTKADLAYIVLTREAYLYEAIESFEAKLKEHDREVFANLRKEIDKLNTLLVDDSVLYPENIELRRQISALEKEKAKLAAELKLVLDTKRYEK
jgi:hypothetical protein